MSEAVFHLVEAFASINGEGVRAGEPAYFLRFAGCNLHCTFCDTKWANTKDVEYTEKTTTELVEMVRKSGIHSVTLTGGEPLLQEGIEELITALGSLGFRVEIETNGSIPLDKFAALHFRPSITMDYKLAGSGQESQMLTENFHLLNRKDTVKFVVGSQEDMERAYAVIHENSLTARCNVFYSPVFGVIDPKEIVQFLLDKRMNGVRLQLQLHKYIWDPETKGV